MSDFLHLKRFLDNDLAGSAFTTLLHDDAIEWHRAVTAEDGTLVPLNRAMAYAVEPAFDTGSYNYAGLQLPSQGFTRALRQILHKLTQDERTRGKGYNSVLLNLYETGKQEIRWHADKEPQLGPTPIICTVNLGASRVFSFQHEETKEKTHLVLEHGDVLLMNEHCQQNYLHAVLKQREVTEPRISLTYRLVS